MPLDFKVCRSCVATTLKLLTKVKEYQICTSSWISEFYLVKNRKAPWRCANKGFRGDVTLKLSTLMKRASDKARTLLYECSLTIVFRFSTKVVPISEPTRIVFKAAISFMYSSPYSRANKYYGVKCRYDTVAGSSIRRIFCEGSVFERT